jgi:hypothetical protein
VLCDDTGRASGAVAEVMDEYRRRTGKVPELFDGTSPGAWHVGTSIISEPG